MDQAEMELRARFRDPYPAYRAARARRIFRDEHGIWYAARYADVTQILKDRRFGKQPPAGAEHRLPSNRRSVDARSILNADPPDHTRLRGLVSRAFSAARVESMRPAVQRLVDEIIDAHFPRGEMEVMRDFAFPIPATIISDMLGVPEQDRAPFAELSNRIIAFGSGVNPEADEDTRHKRADDATAAFDAYLRQLFAVKRREDGDDLTIALIRAQEEGSRLTEEELTQNIRLLFMAGHETTVNLIGNALVALHLHPAQLHLLRQRPELMPVAVEEFLRFDSSVQQLPRIAQETVSVGGQTLHPGEMVICLLGAANRDPDVYEDPDTLDIQRPFARSKSFGGGIHFCLGAQLARVETEIAIGTLLRRTPDLRIPEVGRLEYPLNPFFRGPARLQARWTVTG